MPLAIARTYCVAMQPPRGPVLASASACWTCSRGNPRARTSGDVAPLTIQEFVRRQAADRARYGAFIKEAGIKVH